MMSVWNSIDSLRQLSHALMWAAVVFAIAAAGATWLRFYVDRRAGELVSDAQRQVEDERRRRQEVAESELSNLRTRDEESRKRHEISEKELATLRLKATPRSLSTAERQALLAFLKKEPKGSVVIKANVSAVDARAYADQIGNVLKDAGWVVRIDNAIIMGPDTTGIWITVKDPDKPPPAAGLLQHALKAAGLDARAQHDRSMEVTADEFWLSIGNR